MNLEFLFEQYYFQLFILSGNIFIRFKNSKFLIDQDHFKAIYSEFGKWAFSI